MQPGAARDDSKGEIVFEWSGEIPFKVFMNNYLGPSPREVIEELIAFIRPRVHI
jgi:hypothetical protein